MARDLDRHRPFCTSIVMTRVPTVCDWPSFEVLFITACGTSCTMQKWASVCLDYFVPLSGVSPYLAVPISELSSWSALVPLATHEVLTATLALRGPLDLLAPRMQCIGSDCSFVM